MTLSKELIAQDLWNTMGVVDPDTGAPDLSPNDTIKAYGQGVLDMMTNSTCSFIAGGFRAVAAPPGSPIQGGDGAGGKLGGVVGSVLSSAVSSFLGPEAMVLAKLEHEAVALYIQEAGLVSFATGSVTGTSTATGVNPGILQLGTASAGKLSGLDGGAMYGRVLAATGSSGPNGKDFFTALCDNLNRDTVINFSSGTVVGITTSSGQLTGGVGSGGKVS